MLKTRNIGAHRDLLVLFTRYGRKDFRLSLDPEDIIESLQDDVEPFSFAEVERIVEEELGARISKIFQTFESTPMAAASLGQVHRAALRDGREVVVKVQ